MEWIQAANYNIRIWIVFWCKKYFEDHAQLSEKAYFFDSLLSFGTPQIIWLYVLASARQFIEGTQPLCKLARDSFLIW